MQKAAQEAGGSAVNLDDSTKQQFPSAELADAVFQAAPDVVAGPIKAALGWQVLRVTKVTPGESRTLDQVKDEVQQKVAQDRAVDQVYSRANKLDDALSAGTGLDDLPGDLGLAAVAGTLDAQGNTPAGEPAPIPGPPELRDAIIKAAFATAKGEPPRMVEAPGQSYYALQVEDIIEPKVKPLSEVETQVQDDWIEAQRRHEQEAAAAKLMAAAQAGGSLDDAATVAGLRMEKTPPVMRNGTVEHVPPQLQAALFQLKKGETTMVETPDGFLVVRLTDITEPDPASDPAGAATMREALTRALDQDVQVVFATALRDRARPRVNRTLLDNLVE
jgi:peptidyl-prolyl cis-trans isomerase D